jgi:tetratricopeptide (TPR) repeat protein
MKYSLLLGCTVVLVAFADLAVAKTAAEVESIAKAVTVEIKLQKDGGVGSGVIVDHQGDLYTLVTNNHVVCGNQRCSELPAGESYSLGLVDGQQYRVTASNIKLLGNDLDLAIIQFRSSRKYSVAQVSASNSLKVNDVVYTAGFPFAQPGFSFNGGEVIAAVNKRLTGDDGGYSIIYNAYTLPGMSGGGVFDENVQLVAIHGYGDRYKPGTEINDDSKLAAKIGYNRGIPVRWLIQGLSELGISLSSRGSLSDIRAARQVIPSTADEYFIVGFNKFVVPGANVLAGKRSAIQEFGKAIQINPKYASAYFMRGYVYVQLQDFQQAINDWSQAISINPKYAEAYNGRGNLRKKINDLSGAFSDYNQAISINPKFSEAFNNRGNLKKILNDLSGALSDYNQSILLNPRYVEAFNNRALLKDESLHDLPGALVDYNQAISINPKIADIYFNRGNLRSKLNDLTGSLADYSQVILLNPKDADTFYNRGIVKAYKLNDRAGGIQDFRQAARIYRNQGKAQSSLYAIEQLRKLGATE